MSDIVELHRRVMATSTDVVGKLSAHQLELGTPCAGWTVRDLLAHMIGQNYGFGAAASQRAGTDAFGSRPVGPDPVGEYARSAEFVVAAFAAPGLLERSVYLAEIRGGIEVPVATAISFHLVDYVAHSWDLGVSIGSLPVFDDEVLGAALRVAEAVPDDANRTVPGAAFAPAVQIDAGTAGTVLNRILALLGRDPSWRQAA
ncbi:MAG TPA: TIGR03086 family metal-binding protein [Jatrophihabitantaceae bacterium]|nr:TIGR03086 family metal-binding protein [Jatrophihabitantaceae bacterium]